MTDFKTRALTSLLKWFGRIKPSTRQRIGATLGWLAPRLAKSRTRIMRRNLELCFPDQPEHVREQWVADHFRALAQSIVDRGVLWYGTPEAIKEMVTQTGADRINELTAQGRPVILLAPRLAKSRARIVRRNLELCFPDQPEAVREQWVADHFRALAQSIVDRGVLWYGTPDAIKDMVTQTGADRINALTAEGRAVILLAPHFIALDAAATRLTMEVPSAATMYTPQSDPHIDAVVAAGRARFNEVFLVSRKDGVRDLIRHLRAPRPVYYLPDMDFGRQGSVFVPFFGVPAATLLATAQLAQKWNAAVLPIVGFWNPDTGKYHVDVLPPLEDFPGSDSLEAATARLNRDLESWVRRCPSQYYWVHRRFKTRPEGEPKLY